MGKSKKKTENRKETETSKTITELVRGTIEMATAIPLGCSVHQVSIDYEKTMKEQYDNIRAKLAPPSSVLDVATLHKVSKCSNLNLLEEKFNG